SRSLAQPGLNRTDNRENTLIDFNWSHRFTENWTFRNGVVWSHSNFDLNDLYAASDVSATKTTVDRVAWFGHSDTEMHTVYVNLNGKFETWGIAHDVLIGGDYYSYENTEVDRVIRGIDTVDLFNPVYPVLDVDQQILSQPPNTK